MQNNFLKTIFSIIVLAGAFYFSQSLIVPLLFSIDIDSQTQTAQVSGTVLGNLAASMAPDFSILNENWLKTY